MLQFGDEETKISLEFEEAVEQPPGANIKVVGIGGAGGNAVNRMIEAGIAGVDFVVANTDAQALRQSKAPKKIHIGGKVTKGLGAGAKPEIGREAALEDTNLLIEHLEGADMVFVTAGLGGGTGTGAAPIIASLASELGSLVVAVVTTPFTFEGPRRRRNAESGLKELKGSVDTVITIANDKLLQTVPDKTPFTEAFRFADDVLRQAVQGISDLINVPGIINLDFADVKTIMEGMGVALMGSGSASGENRAVEAAQAAISSPLLEDTSINGARGVLLNIVGGPDMTMTEINEAAMLIHGSCDPDAEIIFGAVTDEKLSGTINVTVIATGFSTPSREMAEETFGTNVAFIDKHRAEKQISPPVNERKPAPENQKDPNHFRSRTGDPFPVGQKDPGRTGDQPGRRGQAAAGTVAGQREQAKARAAQFAAGSEESGQGKHRPSAEMVTPRETLQEVLMTPQSFGANNMGFEDENDLDIPTYLRNLRKRKAQG